MTNQELEFLREWIGRSERCEEVIALNPALRLLAMLDDDVTRLGGGDALPPLWHWLYFVPTVPLRQIGSDGHPIRGGFLPPVPLPRRMFAGARMSFRVPLIIGEAASCRREVISIQRKEGRGGPLIFVEVDQCIEQRGRTCVEERQTIVYRDATLTAPPGASPHAGWDGVEDGDWVRTLTPDPVLLFRFSALTFNAHRIHYDRSYAVNEEGYPGLVVQGPLLALLLIELARHNDSRRMTSFDFRALTPVFDGMPVRLLGKPGASSASLLAQGRGRVLATEANVAFA